MFLKLNEIGSLKCTELLIPPIFVELMWDLPCPRLGIVFCHDSTNLDFNSFKFVILMFSVPLHLLVNLRTKSII